MPIFFDGFDDRYLLSNGWADIDARSDEGYDGWHLYDTGFIDFSYEYADFKGIEQQSPYSESGWSNAAPLDHRYDWYLTGLTKAFGAKYNYWYMSFHMPGHVNMYGGDLFKSYDVESDMLVTFAFQRNGGFWAYHRTGSSTFPYVGNAGKQWSSATWCWMHCEIYIGSGLGSGNDFIKAYVNGELIYEATGLYLGTYTAYSAGGMINTGYSPGVDNLFVEASNSPITVPKGECVVESLRPTANGTDVGFTPNTGTNWSNLTEQVQDFDVSMNSGSGSGTRDCFPIQPLSGRVDVSTSVRGVAVRFFATTDGSDSVKPYIKIGGTRYYGDTVALISGFYRYVEYIWTTNPATASAWTVSDVDAIEAGYEVV